MRRLLAVMVCAAAAPAQTGSYTTFGQACGYQVLTPTVLVPTIGQNFVAYVANIQPSASSVYIWIGLAQLAPPQDLAAFGMPGCSGFVPVDAARRLTIEPLTASATWFFPIPNDNNLIGLTFYNQAIVFDPGHPNPAGAMVTNAAVGVIGT